MWHGFGHGAGFGFGLGFLNLLGTVLFILLVVWLVKAVARGGWRGWPGGPAWRGGRWSADAGGRPGWGGPPWAHGDGDEALRIARERFARGEIGLEEFEALKRALQA